MNNKFDEIKRFWIEAGKSERDYNGLKPTARDPYMQYLNEFYIIQHLNSNNKVLDVGCGEGTSTIVFAKYVKNITGIDYSETLIKQALNKKPVNAQFIIEDILNIKKRFKRNYFDKVISIRCLINLPTIELQYKALDNLFYVLKPNGLLLFSEGYQLGWNNLNIYRQRNGLDPIILVRHNKLFNNLKLEKFIYKYGNIKQFIGFGDYLYGSRVIHPLLTNNNVKHNSDINKIFAELQMKNLLENKYINCSYAGIYIIEKKCK